MIHRSSSFAAPWAFVFGLVAATLIAVPGFAQSGTEKKVEETVHSPLGDGQFHLYVGTLSLPADGLWSIRAPQQADSVRELYLMPTQPTRLRQLGQRMYAALEEQQIQYGRWQVQMGFEACRQFAQENNGRGPRSIEELATDSRWEYLGKRWDAQHWRTNELADLLDDQTAEGPFTHLIPSVRFQFADPAPRPRPGNTQLPVGRLRVPQQDRTVLAFELRPFVDDGKHWVLFTDGNCERVEVDSNLIASQGVEIRPVVSREQVQAAAERPSLQYRVVMVTSDPVAEPLQVTAKNQVLNQEATLRWAADAGNEVSFSETNDALHAARRFAWDPYRMAGSGGVLDVWDQSSDQPAADPRRNLSMFSILGGRAAIEETLQLQNLAVIDSGQEATVDVDSLEGVKVTSHPFEEMLEGQSGGELEMAHYVPHDRFFLYVGKPESIPALLDTGAPFIATLGTTLTSNCLHYNLEARYLQRLGMNRDWVDALLESGMTSEMAIFTPDLFFIDGTDVTVVAKLRQPQLLRGMLAMLGASELTKDSILELPTASGDPAFMALRDDLLIASTHRGELEQSLQLMEQQGEGSLGASAEFRYMLTKMPVNDETRLYAYFSDPFVRRLVSPRVKIAQRRRVLAKAKMEALTGRAMLARLDGHADADSVEDLVSSRHVPRSWRKEGLTVEATGLVRSEHYGTLPRMRTLPEMPMEDVTPEEAEAYRQYRENYENYWRRFFDPIAIRLDDVGRDQLELSTFILPLVDNSIYNGLRMMLAHQDDGLPLSVPVVEPAPVLQFSVNLKDEAWQMVAGNFSEFFTRYSGASPAMLDDFGPSVHVAIFDADPIIAMGSGDIFGAFGGDVLRGGGNDMLMLPVALSMLTRPCSIMVETKSSERTAQYLRQAAQTGVSRGPRGFFDFDVSFYQVEDRDEWVWTMDLFGVVKLRYGVEVVGKYLVIRNIPWSSDDKVVSVVPAELNAAMLQANPSACQLQLPGLFAAAADANRKAVISGLGRLYPFMLSGSESVEAAMTEHQRLYGFYPRQFGDDRWSWTDYRMVSKDYGHPTQQRQPAFDPQRPFGLMNRIDSLQLQMQFEEDGLRSTVRWRLR